MLDEIALQIQRCPQDVLLGEDEWFLAFEEMGERVKNTYGVPFTDPHCPHPNFLCKGMHVVLWRKG